MNNIILETHFGNTFDKVAEEAKQLSVSESNNVQFDFNGINCIVSSTTDLSLLWRDYTNAHLMKWEQIGPDCPTEYDANTLIDLHERTEAAKERAEKQRVEWEEKDSKQRAAFAEKTKGIDIELLNADEWNSWRANNTDTYGDCIFEYAESWAKLMQVEMSQGKTIVECAEPTSHELGFLGITGFMYGAAVSILSHCWKHGKDLRQWHNKKYNHDGEGVVNPAILTLSA